MKSFRLFALALLCACQTDPTNQVERSMADLRPGMRVTVKGVATGSKLQATKIDQRRGKKKSNPDRLEVVAEAQSTIAEKRFRLLHRDIDITKKTDFENKKGDDVAPFPIQAGDWLKVRLGRKSKDRLRARSIRRSKPKSGFEVKGILREVSAEQQKLDVGSLQIFATPATRIRLTADREREEGDPLSVFREDEQKSVPFTIQLTDQIFLGGQLTGRLTFEDEFDLRKSRRRDESNTRATANLDLLWLLDDAGSFALFEGEHRRRDRFEQNRPDTHESSEKLARAYVYYRISDALRLQVGRQDFDDEREWLYDEQLDGIRTYTSLGKLDVELSASIGRQFADERDNDTRNTATFIALLRYRMTKRHHLTAYTIRRRDSSQSNFEPLLFGLRSYARPSKGFGHWLELAQAGGTDGTQPIDGYAFDIGAMYRSRATLQPTVYAGYAYGTGRRPGSGEVGYRQSGLQDNNGRFGGVTSFRYYGEVLEPELTNMDITTLGFGFRPTKSSSIDLIGHTYRQDYKSTAPVSDNLRPTPNGRRSNLGWGADLVFGYRHEDRFSAELIFGLFEPGNAFDDGDAAHKVELQLRWKF